MTLAIVAERVPLQLKTVRNVEIEKAQQMTAQPQPSTQKSPKWSRNTKLIVTICILLLIVFAMVRFSNLVRLVVIASIIAYLLNPLIQLVADRTPLNRNHSILLSYVILVGLMIWGVVSIGVAGYDQVIALIDAFPALFERTIELLQALSQRSFTIFGTTIDLSQINWLQIGDGFLESAQDFLGTLLRGGSSVVGGVTGAAIGGVTLVANFLLILVMSIYISQDVPRVGKMVADWAEMPGYQADAERMWREFGRIWRAYLRGQFILAVVMWLVVWITLAIAGVNNAFALGLLSGALEFLPIIGPVVASGVAVIVALFQPENWMGLPFWQYALVILVIMVILQQIENNILVPRIVGQSLDLHPLVTMLAVFVGSSLAGILGAILAAPLAATFKLVGGYVWRKLFDQPPFPKPEKDDTAASPSFLMTSWLWLKNQARKLRTKQEQAQAASKKPASKSAEKSKPAATPQKKKK